MVFLRLLTIVLVFCTLFSAQVFASNPTIDSLKNLLVQAEGEQRFALLIELVDHSRTVDYGQSQQWLKEATQIAGADSSSHKYAEVLLRRGRSKAHEGLFGEAVALYFSALRGYQQHNDSTQTGYTLCDVGIAYAYNDELEQAESYMRKSLSIFTALDHEKGQADLLNNIGSVLDMTGRTDSALVYYEKSLAIKERTGNLKGVLNGLINVGVVYLDQNELDKAWQNFVQAGKIADQLNDAEGAYAANFNKGLVLEKKGQFRAAIARVEQACENAENADMDFRLHEGLWRLSHLYHKAGDHAAAYQQLQDYITLGDSISVKENRQQMAELDARYQSELKEQQIDLLDKSRALQQSQLEQRQQVVVLLAAMLLLSLLLGGAVFLYHRSRQKQRQLAQDYLLKMQQAEAERLQELNQVKSRFFANIAHEFRTPLTLIAAPAQQIQGEAENAKIRKNASLINSSAARLLVLVNQLLDLSKLESGVVQLQTQPGDLAAFVKGITSSFESLATERRVRLMYESTCREAMTDIDPGRTDKIFVNLLSNAFKFTPSGGCITVSFQLSITDDGQQMAVITVRDTGPGILPENLAHVFSRFYQAADTGAGTGIGLALVKELVTLHQGSIQAASEPGKGAAFTVQLPVACAEELPLPQTEQISDEMAEAPASQLLKPGLPLQNLPNTEEKPVVLVIEDNEDVRRYIMRCLWQEYHILEAADGESGVRLALEQVPDLVISDVTMPEKDGLEVCRLLKADQKTSHVPVILLTARADVEHRVHGLESGADDYLAKPFHYGELLARVGNIIASRQELRRKFAEQMSVATEKMPGLQNREDSFLAGVYKVLDQHLSEEDFGIEQLCRQVGMSRTQLHRKLKALTNLSASHFIRQYRLQQAIILLKQERFTIAEVAWQVGFSSPSYFSQCFSEVYGFAPSTVAKA